MLYIVPNKKISYVLRTLCYESVSIGCQYFEPKEDKDFWFEEYPDHVRASSQEGLEWLFQKAVYQYYN